MHFNLKRSVLFFCLPFFLAAAPVSAGDVFVVSHVSDGDTLILQDGRRVRLIGVDTPEMHDKQRNREDARRNHLNEKTVAKFAEKAKKFVQDAVEGRSVRLEYDWEREDKYGRTLAYVYREEDGYFLNEAILREGYGFAYLVFPFKYTEEFRSLGSEAQKEGRGLWKS